MWIVKLVLSWFYYLISMFCVGRGVDSFSMVITTLDELISECEQSIATLSGTLISISNKYKVGIHLIQTH